MGGLGGGGGEGEGHMNLCGVRLQLSRRAGGMLLSENFRCSEVHSEAI